MHNFISDDSEQRALSKQLGQTGTLSMFTRIEIRGDYAAGPVPVHVTYETRFVPDEEFWERHEQFPEEEPYSVSYQKQFASPQERAFYCKTFYDVV
jgi:hypothetical protein